MSRKQADELGPLFALQAEPEEPLTRAGAERLASIARLLVEAALANEYVRLDMRDLLLSPPVTAASIRANPPVKVEFEHAFVIAGLGDALAVSRNKKSFGALVGVLPLDVADPFHPHRVLYVYKDSSPYNRRVEQRKWLKKRLGKGARKLVTLAMRETKGEFLRWMDDPRHGWPDAAQIVRRTLGMDAGRFWRVARGKEMIEIPHAPVQLLLPLGLEG
jgi:hypothetical protein